jgi:murein DD-endopeptidase MepM/ murein hydrolase activator NlpD
MTAWPELGKKGVKPVLGSFRIRLLVVIALVALVGYSLQSGSWSRKLVEPALRVILHEDQWTKQILADFSERLAGQPAQPATSDRILQLPCAYTAVIRPFASARDAGQKQSEPFPGILLQVNPNAMVKPVLPGKVVMVKGESGEYTVLLEHEEGLTSEYGHLARVLLRAGQTATKDTVIGRSGSQLYFAINSPQGPLDPSSLFP